MTTRLNATLVVAPGGLVADIRCYTEYPCPIGLTPDAWFAAELAAGREWRVVTDTPKPDGTRVLSISRPA